MQRRTDCGRTYYDNDVGVLTHNDANYHDNSRNDYCNDHSRTDHHSVADDVNVDYANDDYDNG